MCSGISLFLCVFSFATFFLNQLFSESVPVFFCSVWNMSGDWSSLGSCNFILTILAFKKQSSDTEFNTLAYFIKLWPKVDRRLNECMSMIPTCTKSNVSKRHSSVWILLFSLKGFWDFIALLKFKCFFKFYLGFVLKECLGLCSQVAFHHLMYLLLLLLLVVPKFIMMIRPGVCLFFPVCDWFSFR